MRARVLPASTQVLKDPPLTSGIPVYLEALQALAALGGAAQTFDGNGAVLRGLTGGGKIPVKTSVLPSQGPLFGNASLTPLGTRPKFPGKLPPLRPAVGCASTPAPDLRTDKGSGP